MQKTYTLIYVFVLISLSQIIHAQGIDSTKKVDLTKKVDSTKKKSSLLIGVNYISNNVYLGRTDSVVTPNFNAQVTYTLKSGIYFSGGLTYIPNRTFDRLDAGILEAGYTFDHNDLSGAVSVSKYFASFISTEVVSAIDANLSGELDYDFHFISASIKADYALAKSNGGNDFILTGGLQHEFDVTNPFSTNDALSISPAIFLNAGTQNFYTTYIIRKKNSAAAIKAHGGGKGKTVNPVAPAPTSTTSTVNTNKFQLLDNEYEIPITYSIKNLGFEFTPKYVVGHNIISDNPTTTTTYIPNTSLFYFKIGINYTF